MKVSELEGVALDEWVAAAAGHQGLVVGSRFLVHTRADGYRLADPGKGVRFAPSADWAQGGTVIEEEKLMVQPLLERGDFHGNWRSVALSFPGRQHADMQGPTPLIAAMRAFVASVYGDEVGE